MTLIPTDNKNILVFEKSKWIRKQKLNSNIGFFLEFFFQLILATGSQNRSPDIIVYYGIWARVSTKRAAALFSREATLELALSVRSSVRPSVRNASLKES